jgi:aryl-phospho-beta-D-glucosidase BglC (GH1 family)
MPDPEQAVVALDNFVSSVYMSSPEYVRAKDPGACDMEAMTSLTCNKEDPFLTAPWANKLNNNPIRGVNLGGLFILERWILTGLLKWDDASEGTKGIIDTLTFSKKCATVPSGSICHLYEDHINRFYTQSDFDAMKRFGLNTVRISVGYWYFYELSQVKSSVYLKPKASIHDLNHPLTKIIQHAKRADLQVILTLASVTDNDLDVDVNMLTSSREITRSRIPAPSPAVTTSSVTITTAEAIADYVSMISAHSNNVLMIEINTPVSKHVFDTVGDKDTIEQSVQNIRKTLLDIPVLVLESSFIPSENVLVNNQRVYSNMYVNTKVYHSGNVQDIASDSPEADREKMFAHEKIACGFKGKTN